MLGKKYGYYTTDPETAWKIDSTIDALGDLQNSYYRVMFEKDSETKKKLFEDFLSRIFPQWCQVMQKRLQENSTQKYIAGDKMSIADFALAGLAYSTFMNDANP